jgi:hypothetical protein
MCFFSVFSAYSTLFNILKSIPNQKYNFCTYNFNLHAPKWVGLIEQIKPTVFSRSNLNSPLKKITYHKTKWKPCRTLLSESGACAEWGAFMTNSPPFLPPIRYKRGSGMHWRTDWHNLEQLGSWTSKLQDVISDCWWHQSEKLSWIYRVRYRFGGHTKQGTDKQVYRGVYKN